MTEAERLAEVMQAACETSVLRQGMALRPKPRTIAIVEIGEAHLMRTEFQPIAGPRRDAVSRSAVGAARRPTRALCSGPSRSWRELGRGEDGSGEPRHVGGVP